MFSSALMDGEDLVEEINRDGHFVEWPDFRNSRDYSLYGVFGRHKYMRALDAA